MASYNLSFNSDDSVIRHVIIGLLADLNNKVYFYRQLNEKDRVAIDIPFYYSITGDDQFLRDNFLFTTTNGPDCHPDISFADGNYDVVPRGVVNLTGMSIDSGKLINKKNMGTYTKLNSDGAMEGYSTEFEMIPITLSVDIEILVSSTLDSFKITEMLIKQLYKSNAFNVEVGHLNEATYRLNSYYAMPDDYDIQRPIDFTFEDKDKYKISFPIEINTSIPSFDWESETHTGNRMFEINSTTIPSSDAGFNSPGEIAIIDSKGFKKYDEKSNNVNTGIIEDNIIVLNGSKPSFEFINGSLVSNLIINTDGTSSETTIVATESDLTIDISNFPGVSDITIHASGSLTIKRNGNTWYIIGENNTTINY